MNKELWTKCVQFHGHECPGLAIGYKVSEAAKEKLGLSFSKDEEIVCIAENDACCVDAVQVLTGCSVGKGNLLFKDSGKMAFTFFSRTDKEGVRIVVKSRKKSENRQREMEYILDASYDELFEFKKPSFQLPERARIFTSVVCEECGEASAEHKIRFMNGKKVCGDCFKDYSRNL
ncbi:FmdE family protein [Clostridium sp. CX1]|uniref:FmdE family protein n=1 Tax=Clostridium sp. CX1 TaxID=2978346 RepID=UPI0021C13544|nr:FmdE family protein [Clostridium sp. CX1]MCT8977397.1 FmdE family protein [Clostridium sp. CX1]